MAQRHHEYVRILVHERRKGAYMGWHSLPDTPLEIWIAMILHFQQKTQFHFKVRLSEDSSEFSLRNFTHMNWMFSICGMERKACGRLILHATLTSCSPYTRRNWKKSYTHSQPVHNRSSSDTYPARSGQKSFSIPSSRWMSKMSRFIRRSLMRRKRWRLSMITLCIGIIS